MYHFREDTATADIAYEVEATTLNQLFEEAGEALSKTSIPDLNTVQQAHTINVELSADSIEELLYEFLEELVFIKDTQHFIPNAIKAQVGEEEDHPNIKAELKGEKIDLNRHQIGNDVKAITYHQFKLQKTDKGYDAFVLLDV